MESSTPSEFIEEINKRWLETREAVIADRKKISAADDLLYSARWHLWGAAVNAAKYRIYEQAVTATEERGEQAGIRALSIGIAHGYGSRPFYTNPFCRAVRDAQREAAHQVLTDMRHHVDYAELAKHVS